MEGATVSLHILRTPMQENWRKSVGERWCFVCRQRRQFEHVQTQPIDEFSYYGPSDHIECTFCKTTDGDCFPGTEREWSDV